MQIYRKRMSVPEAEAPIPLLLVAVLLLNSGQKTFRNSIAENTKPIRMIGWVDINDYNDGWY